MKCCVQVPTIREANGIPPWLSAKECWQAGPRARALKGGSRRRISSSRWRQLLCLSSSSMKMASLLWQPSPSTAMPGGELKCLQNGGQQSKCCVRDADMRRLSTASRDLHQVTSIACVQLCRPHVRSLSWQLVQDFEHHPGLQSGASNTAHCQAFFRQPYFLWLSYEAGPPLKCPSLWIMAKKSSLHI